MHSLGIQHTTRRVTTPQEHAQGSFIAQMCVGVRVGSQIHSIQKQLSLPAQQNKSKQADGLASNATLTFKQTPLALLQLPDVGLIKSLEWRDWLLLVFLSAQADAILAPAALLAVPASPTSSAAVPASCFEALPTCLFTMACE